MQEKIENAKHEIAVLVENILYDTIVGLIGDDIECMTMEYIEENKNTKMAIDIFAKQCIKKYPQLSQEEIIKHIKDVLDRTIKNIKKMNDEKEGR